MTTMRRFALGLAAAVLAAGLPAAAAAESTSQEVAYGVGSVTTTLVYAPIKASFCILGAVTSGFTLPFGGPRTAEKVASAACGGTWAVTPAALKGREPVRFVGGGEAPGRAAAKR
jgi:4-hydroxybenzoate polyprenyltransferase